MSTQRKLLKWAALALFLALHARQTEAGFDFDLNELPPEEGEELQLGNGGQPLELPRPEAFRFEGYPTLGEPEGGGGSREEKRGKRARFMGAMRKLGAKTSEAVKKLPDYFDFERFTRKFKRTYSAQMAPFRKSMFLRRCMRVFKLRVSDRLGKPTHLEEVNKFADRSPNEIKRMFMSAPPVELKPAGQSLEEYRSGMESEFRRRQAWDAELETQASLESLGAGHQAGEEAEAKREIELMLAQAEDLEEAEAIAEELLGLQADSFSQSSLADTSGRELPWPGQQRSSARAPEAEDGAPEPPYVPPKLAQGDQLDWSRHDCFHSVYDQKDKCGKCYVMASTALAEFYKCTEERDKIDKRKFSKEYVLDCGQKYSPSTIYGCKGGSMLDTSKFIAVAGIYNIKGWRSKLAGELQRLRAQGEFLSPIDEACPLNQFESSFESWGEIRVQFKPVKIAVNEWYEALQDGPLVASVQMPDGVEAYKSGTHNGDTCDGSKNWHTMILVGYGTDANGVAYWRFRNSFGPDWGEQGHFNLAMSVPGSCLIGGVRFYREPLDS